MIELSHSGIFLTFMWVLKYTLSQAICDFGWFGPNCQYKDQCSFFNCYNDGMTWNGYKSQYAFFDLNGTFTVSSKKNVTFDTQIWSDFNDDTCISDATITRISTFPYMKAPFTFVRLAVKDAALIYKFKLTIEEYDGYIINRFPCRRQVFTAVSDTVVDVRCDFFGTNYSVILEGEGVTALCSIGLVLGRNAALKQSVEQTSTVGTNYAKYAVDGNSADTCAITNNESRIWTLILDEPIVVTAFRLYSPAFVKNDHRLYSFNQSDENVWIHSLYDTQIFFKNLNRVPVKKVQVTSNAGYLHLCEVIVYGMCTPGMWGLDCKKQCASKCPDFCSDLNGTCPTNCLGYQLPGCIAECPVGKWGLNCAQDCSDRCQYKYCNNVDGLCTAGCNGYSDPPNCTNACETGYYGTNCGSNCSSNCVNAECDHRDGTCILGCKDKHGPFCNTSTPDDSTFGIAIGVGVGSVLLGVVVVAVIVICKRYNSKLKQTQADPGITENNQTILAQTVITEGTTLETVQGTNTYDTPNGSDGYVEPESESPYYQPSFPQAETRESNTLQTVQVSDTDVSISSIFSNDYLLPEFHYPIQSN